MLGQIQEHGQMPDPYIIRGNARTCWAITRSIGVRALEQIAPAAHCVHACSLRRSELVAVALLLALALGGLDAHLLVVLLQGSEILAGL